MAASHLEFLVEEPSMEAFLCALLPRLLPQDRTFEVHPFQGKSDLLAKLESRLRAYASWLPPDWRLVVVVDRDDDECHALKQQLEAIATRSGLRTRSSAGNDRSKNSKPGTSATGTRCGRSIPAHLQTCLPGKAFAIRMPSREAPGKPSKECSSAMAMSRAGSARSTPPVRWVPFWIHSAADPPASGLFIKP